MEFKKWLLEVGGQNDQPDLQPVSAMIASNRGGIWTYNKDEIRQLVGQKNRGLELLGPRNAQNLK